MKEGLKKGGGVMPVWLRRYCFLMLAICVVALSGRALIELTQPDCNLVNAYNGVTHPGYNWFHLQRCKKELKETTPYFF